jgi:hypothetical protein
MPNVTPTMPHITPLCAYRYTRCVARRLPRDTNGRRQCLPIHRCVPTDTSRYVAYHNACRHTTRPLLLLQRTTYIDNMVEQACGCVPCVTCKRMFKGDRGLSLHAIRTGCGDRWFHMDGTTYVTRWNKMMQTLPCRCAMK